ncbi:cysteine-rich and transmembrane domain-containing protein 1 [Tamandua tetradactyla]|uniref:cysteine-rich and transmembrane domain-containing protein 1 n=1 Tax=Tamandua tetradactyla TaxID=48850 RepID=UPI0040548525
METRVLHSAQRPAQGSRGQASGPGGVNGRRALPAAPRELGGWGRGPRCDSELRTLQAAVTSGARRLLIRCEASAARRVLSLCVRSDSDQTSVQPVSGARRIDEKAEKRLRFLWRFRGPTVCSGACCGGVSGSRGLRWTGSPGLRRRLAEGVQRRYSLQFPMNPGNPPPYSGPGPTAPYPPYPQPPMGPGSYPPGPTGGPYPPPQGYPYQGYPQYGWQGGPQEPPKTTVYVMEQERKTADTGCQAALAACWTALCCCCLLDSLD